MCWFILLLVVIGNCCIYISVDGIMWVGRYVCSCVSSVVLLGCIVLVGIRYVVSYVFVLVFWVIIMVVLMLGRWLSIVVILFGLM